MNRLIVIGSVAVAALLTAEVQAETAQEIRVAEAVDVIRDFTAIPESAIPPNILSDAYGVAVIPGSIKAGFIIGGRYGKGVLMVRRDDGTWSNPGFISMGGGSLGWQIGAQSTDIVLIFKERRSIDNIFNGKLTLGGDAAIAAGPVGRQSMAATDEMLKAEIFSYSRNRGLFAGISLEGSWLGMDRKSNTAYYGNDMSPEQIFTARDMFAPVQAEELVALLAKAAPRPNIRLADNGHRSSNAAPAASSSESSEPKVYSLEPLDSGDDALGYSGDETAF